MGKTRIHLSLSASILEKLDAIAVSRDFDDRVALFEQLVREEWERRNGPALILRDQPPTADQLAAAEIERARIAAGTGHTPAGAAYSHTGTAKPRARPRSAKG